MTCRTELVPFSASGVRYLRNLAVRYEIECCLPPTSWKRNKFRSTTVNKGNYVRVAGLLIAVTTIGVLIFGAKFTWKTLELVRDGIEVTATVRTVNAQEEKITFDFVDQSGNEHMATLKDGDYLTRLVHDGKVKMIYVPSDPTSAEINAFWPLWHGPIVCGGLAAVWGFLACAFLFGRKAAL